MIVKGLWTLVVTVTVFLAAGVADASEQQKESHFDYSIYNDLLSTYVDEQGQVNYSALKKNPYELDFYLEQLKVLSKEEFDTWTKNDQIAFWTNAYNALTLKVIVDHYPIKASGLSALAYPKNSIRQIDGVWKKITFSVMGEKMTLDHIEHGILRKKYSNPGIHMALVCAARSCPFLRQEAYTGAALQKQFDDQSRRFLKSEKGLLIDRKKHKVNVSSLFKWFASDFEKKYSSTGMYTKHRKEERAFLNYIARFVDEETKQYLEKEDYAIGYLSYDWTLNDKPGN